MTERCLQDIHKLGLGFTDYVILLVIGFSLCEVNVIQNVPVSVRLTDGLKRHGVPLSSFDLYGTRTHVSLIARTRTMRRHLLAFLHIWHAVNRALSPASRSFTHNLEDKNETHQHGDYDFFF